MFNIQESFWILLFQTRRLKRPFLLTQACARSVSPVVLMTQFIYVRMAALQRIKSLLRQRYWKFFINVSSEFRGKFWDLLKDTIKGQETGKASKPRHFVIASFIADETNRNLSRNTIRMKILTNRTKIRLPSMSWTQLTVKTGSKYDNLVCSYLVCLQIVHHAKFSSLPDHFHRRLQLLRRSSPQSASFNLPHASALHNTTATGCKAS